MGYLACSAGPKEQEANNLLEKKVKKGDMDLKQAIKCAVLSLQTVIGSDLKPTGLSFKYIIHCCSCFS